MSGLRAQIIFLGLFIGDALAQSSAPPTFLPIVFFPPTPPVYGAAIPDQPPNSAMWVGGRRLIPPGGLGDFVGEDIYPALSTRLFALDLKPKLEQRVYEYRAKRLQQVNALLNQFVVLHHASAEERTRALRAFAETQTPLLVSLEQEGEQLRQDLIADGFRNEIDWNASRRWKMNAPKNGENFPTAEAEFQVIRAAAHYERGLLPQQRGLLRELAIELRMTARKARGLPTARSESDAMFFSPETARFRLPIDLPPVLREKIGAYNGQKAALKRELRETVVAHDMSRPGERQRAFEALGDRQWPQLRSLEELAEEIRILIASRVEVTAPPPPPWIPPGILQTIHAYNDDRDAYFGELQARMTAAAAAVPSPDDAETADERIERRRDFTAQVGEARRRATMQFQEENEKRFAQLMQRYQAIRQALTSIAEKQVDRRTGKPLDADALLRVYAASMQEFDTFGRVASIYTHYRLAMFEVGLSAEQRRLLFAYALAGLAQPLPNGEVSPRKNATKPYPTS